VGSILSLALLGGCITDERGGRLINTLSTTQDFVHYFSICRPRFVFVDKSLWDVANVALYEIRGLETTQVIVLGDEKDDVVHVRMSYNLGVNFHLLTESSFL
jgi:hypothetical protein